MLLIFLVVMLFILLKFPAKQWPRCSYSYVKYLQILFKSAALRLLYIREEFKYKYDF